MRRLVAFLAVMISTALAGLWWLHDGDLEDAVGPLLDEVPVPEVELPGSTPPSESEKDP